MAVSRDTSNGPDWKDTAAHLVAFQSINKCSVDLGLQVVVKGSRIELMLTGKAWVQGIDKRAVPPLASASVTCSATGLKSLEAAVIALLYSLDGQLAANEFAHLGENKSEAPGTE